MSYPTIDELKTGFKREEKLSQKAYRVTKPKKPKQQVIIEFTQKLYDVWKNEYKYHSVEVLDYLLGRKRS